MTHCRMGNSGCTKRKKILPTRVVQLRHKAMRGGGISAAGHVQKLSRQALEQPDPTVKSVGLGEVGWNRLPDVPPPTELL